MAEYLEEFEYDDYDDFVATSGWTVLDPPSTMDISFGGFMDINLELGDNDAISMIRTLDGSWAGADAPLLDLSFNWGFDAPYEAGVVAVGAVNSALAEGWSVTLIRSTGGDSINVTCTWSGENVNESVSGIGGGALIRVTMDPGTRIVTFQIKDLGDVLWEYDSNTPLPSDSYDTLILQGGGSPISGPPGGWYLSINHLYSTYGAGGSVTYYTPNLTGEFKSKKTTFFGGGRG